MKGKRTHRPIPNLDELRKLINYCPETGVFTNVKKNKQYTSTNPYGYIYIDIKRKKYMAHILAWYIMTGHYPKFPTEQIDHENRIRSDNRWKNLRLATHQQNLANSYINNSRSGFKGVRITPDGKKWESKKDYKLEDGKRKHLVFGYFDTAKEAAACYNENVFKIDGDFAYLNKIPQFVTKAVVLAGGSGSRLKPITNTMNKQIIPIANVPTCHYIIKKVVESGVFEIAVVISPQNGEVVKQSILNSFPNIRFTFIYQEKPLGIAHGLLLCENFIKDSTFFLCLGDNLINSDLRPLRKELMYQNHALILLKEVPDPSRYGIAELSEDGSKIVKLEEKPESPKSNLAVTGIYVFRPNIFEHIKKLEFSKRGELEIVEAIQSLIDEGKTVSYKSLDGWYLDTGKKDTLLEANRTILAENKLEQKIDPSSNVVNSRVIGPVIIGKNCHIENCYIGPYTSIGDNCILKNTMIQDSILIGNSHIENTSKLITETVVGEGAKIGNFSNNSMELMIGDNSHVSL